MKIAVASDRPELDGLVPANFSQSPFLLIVELDTGELLSAVARGPEGDLELARVILSQDCEGLLCGPIEREPFLIIADEGGVTRYLAAGLKVREALEQTRQRNLELIRDHIGGQGHRHQPSGGQCSGSH